MPNSTQIGQERLSHNLDLLLFSLLNLIFFICFYTTFQDPNSYFLPTLCTELPRPAHFLQYIHLAFVIIFFASFLLKVYHFSYENQEKLITKAMMCLMNMSLFSSFFVFVGIYLDIIYTYVNSSDDCMKLGQLVLADIIVSIISYGFVVTYRLCFKAMLTNMPDYEREMALSASKIKSGISKSGNKEKYGTMNDEDHQEGIAVEF